MPNFRARQKISVNGLASFLPLFERETARSHVDTLSEKVYRALKRDIIRCIYQPGEALSEKLLTVKYKGSRTPVREAVVRLQQERLLRAVPDRGYFVNQLTLQEVNDVYEFRSAVECLAADRAARNGVDAESLHRLTEFAQVRYTDGDPDSYGRFIGADTSFHVGIARLSRNQMLFRAVVDARTQMERIMYAAISVQFYGDSAWREHQQILKAIQERNPEQARRLMYKHIIQSKDEILGMARGAPGRPRSSRRKNARY
ncbi:MAG: GntR family transcriptional regulator [Candidatus Acidiferrales bacterium]